jgi:hypothetical protein
MTERLLAGIVLAIVLWAVFRFAMGLRATKLAREQALGAESARGRRAIAEIPLSGGELMLFLEDGNGFYWGAEGVRKSDVLGARILLNGGVLSTFVRKGATLPEPPSPEAYQGKERWDVEVYLRTGRVLEVACGTLREGVSRDVAAAVFKALRDGAQP